MEQFTETASQKNHFAWVSLGAGVAAIVLTFSTQVVLGLIAGVIALTAGLFALSLAKKYGVGRGRTIAGMILGGIPLALLVVAGSLVG